MGYVPTFGRTPLSIISTSLGKYIHPRAKSGVSVPRKRRTDLYENALSSLVRVTPDVKSLSSDGRRVYTDMFLLFIRLPPPLLHVWRTL